MAAGGSPGPGSGPSAGPGGAGGGGGPGSRRGSASRGAEAEVWSRRVRDVVSAAPGNRRCFECGQRGVTYVDITVGSLVCTGCSGALRGLNPPHRVKSISMTTFTEAEVLFLQAHGNEACHRVWLGSFDPRSSPHPDVRDPQSLKEFLQDKYERKRWYVAPEAPKPPPSAVVSSQPLLGDVGTLQQPHPALQRPPQRTRKASTDLLADIGGDPFATPQPAPPSAAFPGPAQPCTAFPSVDAFGAGPAILGAIRGSAAGGEVASAPPTGGGASVSVFGTLHTPLLPYGGYTNPFVAPPRPCTNPFQSDGAALAAPPLPSAFPPPLQADGSAFRGFNGVKASTNPFVMVPAAPIGTKHPATNPFL